MGPGFKHLSGSQYSVLNTDLKPADCPAEEFRVRREEEIKLQNLRGWFLDHPQHHLQLGNPAGAEGCCKAEMGTDTPSRALFSEELSKTK